MLLVLFSQKRAFFWNFFCALTVRISRYLLLLSDRIMRFLFFRVEKRRIQPSCRHWKFYRFFRHCLGLNRSKRSNTAKINMQICESIGDIDSKLESSIRLMLRWPFWSCALHDKRLKGPGYSIWWCPKPQKRPKKCQKWLLTLIDLNKNYTLKHSYTFR